MVRLKILVVLVSLVSLNACVTQPVQGHLSPAAATERCTAEIGPPFLPDGHLYTTLTIARIASLPDERQLSLAFFSQYPDLDPDYEAVPVSLKYLFVPNKWRWRNDIAGKLHSLHGGGRTKIDLRRSEIRRAIARNLSDPQKDWQTGLLIHALGDTYAHTKNEYGSEDERAYGVWVGHLFPSIFCRSPDDIKAQSNEPKYLGYITDLYTTLGGSTSDDSEFREFYRFVDEIECESGQCPNFHALFYEGEADSKSRIDRFQECMLSNMRRLTKSEVQSVMDQLSDIGG